jgi:hypothetical protein
VNDHAYVSKGEKDQKTQARRHRVALFYLITPHCLFQVTMTKSTFVTQHLYIYSDFTSAEGPPPTPCKLWIPIAESVRGLDSIDPSKYTRCVPPHCSEKQDGRKLEISTHITHPLPSLSRTHRTTEHQPSYSRPAIR